MVGWLPHGHLPLFSFNFSRLLHALHDLEVRHLTFKVTFKVRVSGSLGLFGRFVSILEDKVDPEVGELFLLLSPKSNPESGFVASTDPKGHRCRKAVATDGKTQMVLCQDVKGRSLKWVLPKKIQPI